MAANNESQVEIVGSYRLDRNENLDEYFKATGVSYLARWMMLSFSPTMTVTFEEDTETWVFKTVSYFRTIIHSFKVDDVCTEELSNGETLESVTTRDGPSTFITKTTNDPTGDFEQICDFFPDELIITLKHSKGVQAKRFFKRVTE